MDYLHSDHRNEYLLTKLQKDQKLGFIERGSPLRRIKSEFLSKKQREEAKSGFSVTSYKSKVERA